MRGQTKCAHLLHHEGWHNAELSCVMIVHPQCPQTVLLPGRDPAHSLGHLFLMFLISAALYFNVFYKYLSNKKLLRILPCQKFHLS